jgi:outer membrane protein assembly factor BamB
VASGAVYVGSGDNNVYALDASTGSLLWSYATGGPVSSSPALVNGVVYVGAESSDVYALNASTGSLLWSYPADIVGSSPAVANGVVYVGSFDDNIYAFGLQDGQGAGSAGLSILKNARSESQRASRAPADSAF